jgi:hypothetical protein
MDWTSEQDAQLAKLAAEGKSSMEIGKAMHITKNAVIGRARRRGVQLANKAPIAQTPEMQAKRLATRRENRANLPEERLVHTSAGEVKFRAMWADGTSSRVIAEHFRTSENTVTNIRARLNLTPRKQRADNITPDQIAERPTLPNQREIAATSARITTTQGQAIFRGMWLRGDPTKDIAAYFEISEKSASNYRIRLDLTPRHQYTERGSGGSPKSPPMVRMFPVNPIAKRIGIGHQTPHRPGDAAHERSVGMRVRHDLVPMSTLDDNAAALHAPEEAPCLTSDVVTAYLARSPRACQWPTGNGPFVFACDDPANFGYPYCAGHCQISYVRVQDYGKYVGMPPASAIIDAEAVA